MVSFFERFSKYEIDNNDLIILKKIHELTKMPKQKIIIGFRILPTGYVLEKDTGELVDYIMNNTIYNTQKKALDILKTIQNNTEYFSYIGTLNNGGPAEFCLSPTGVLVLYENLNKPLIHYIMKGLYFVYNQEPSINLTNIKNRPNTMMMEDFYHQLFRNEEVEYEVFRNIFHGLKELGYIEGTGGIETLQANDLKLTGLGIKYVETIMNKPVQKVNTNNGNKEGDIQQNNTVENNPQNIDDAVVGEVNATSTEINEQEV